MAETVEHVQLKPETLEAFEAYVRAAEEAMEAAPEGHGQLLWVERDQGRLQQVRKGTAIAEYWDSEKSSHPTQIPHGLIHDWVGSVFVLGGTVMQVIALVQDYANHKNIYKPEVLESAIVSRVGDDFKIYLRLLKKKIITVVLDTYHDVHYASPEVNRALCRSHTTEILEVEHAGTPKETKMKPDTGHGFLWRLNSYWRFEEKDGGVFVECRAISLTRDVPTALAWLITPIVRKLPKESLVNTLEATRKALADVVTVEAQQTTPQQRQI